MKVETSKIQCFKMIWTTKWQIMVFKEISSIRIKINNPWCNLLPLLLKAHLKLNKIPRAWLNSTNNNLISINNHSKISSSSNKTKHNSSWCSNSRLLNHKFKMITTTIKTIRLTSRIHNSNNNNNSSSNNNSLLQQLMVWVLNNMLLNNTKTRWEGKINNSSLNNSNLFNNSSSNSNSNLLEETKLQPNRWD